MRIVRSLLLPLLCLFYIALPATASAQASIPASPYISWSASRPAGRTTSLPHHGAAVDHLGQQFVIENRVSLAA